MSAFVTETLPEDLKILLFSQSPVLSDLFAEHLTQHGLEVTQKSSDSGTLAKFLDSGYSPSWYKVFWIDDVSHITIDQAKKMVKIFQEIKGLSYVVMHQPFHYQGIKNIELIGQNLIDVNVFFEQRSPYTTLLTFKDLLSNESFSLNYQQIIHFLNQSKFPFTTDQLEFITEKELMEGLVALSFDPRGGKRRVVVGKKPHLTKSVMKAIQSEFRRRFKGEEVTLQKEVSVEWGSGFKEFSVPNTPTLEEIVSELIVEAKFHYQPAKRVEEHDHSDIPKPLIPKPKKIEEPQAEEPKSQKTISKPEPEKNEDDELSHRIEQEIEKKRQERLAQASGALISPQVIQKPTKVVTKPSQPLPPTLNLIENLPLSQLVPKSLMQSSSQLVNAGILESSIQVKVNAPLATMPKRAPVLIPEQKIPDIRRSKIILQQFSTSMEKHVQKKAEPEFHIPKVNPQITARVHQEQQEEKQKSLTQEKEDDLQKKLLEKKIASLFSGTLKPQKVVTLRKERKLTPLQQLFGRDTKVGKWYRAQKGIFWLGLSIFITTTILVGTFFISISSLQAKLIETIQQFQQETGVDELMIARLSSSQSVVEKQLNIYSSVVGTGVFSDTYEQVEVAKKLATLSTALREIDARHIQTTRQVLGSVAGDPVETLTRSLVQTDVVYKQLSLLEGELEGDSTNTFFQTNFTEDQRKDFIDTISEVRRNVLIGQQLTEILPNTLNKQKKKTIAVVLQDAQELRATGGFIQSVALVTLDAGIISDIKMIKPDDLATGVGGQVAPPEEVTQYLGEQQWFLRDGNWHPDFEITAKQIQFFIQTGLNTSVDGVIGVNTLSLAKILGAIGPITLPEFDDETITEKNFSEREFFYAKASLLDTQDAKTKPDFLTVSFKAILDKLQNSDDLQTKQLLTVVEEQFKQAEITASFQDLATETTFGTLGWTGGIISPPCPTQLVQDQCLVSRMYQVDSNVGINKVNFTVKKKVDHSVQIKEAEIIHKRVITYENSSATNSWPGGVYKNYIRWILPDNATVKIITINDKAVDPALIKQYKEKTSLIVGVFTEVLPETTSKIVIEYSEEPIGKQASYAFFDQKQPGTNSTPTKISVFYDESYTPIIIAPDAQISGEKIEYSFWGGEHVFAGVKFR